MTVLTREMGSVLWSSPSLLSSPIPSTSTPPFVNNSRRAASHLFDFQMHLCLSISTAAKSEENTVPVEGKWGAGGGLGGQVRHLDSWGS